MHRTPERRLLFILALLLGLAACGAPQAPQVPGQDTPAEPAGASLSAQTHAGPTDADDLDALIDAANAALAADRMFAPPGDNALELLLRVTEARPDDARARQGLVDILPFVLIGLEQRLAAGDVAETERLLALFRRADPSHPALRRLGEQLEAERARRELAEAARIDADERRAALAAESVAASPVAADAPAEAAPRSVQPPTRSPASPALAASEPAKPAAPGPAPAVPAHQPTPPTPATAALPPVLAQVAARYPPQAQRRRIEGLVEVEFTVRADGSVADARILRSEPAGVFDREALGAIQRWRFEATGREVVGRRVFDFRLGG